MWLDKYCDFDTVIHNWEPRVKIIGLMTLIFTFAFISTLKLIPFIVVISLSVYLLSGLPFSFLFSRLRIPGFFLIIMLVLLVFISKGTVLFKLGPLAVKEEGLLSSLLIGGRFLSILTLIIVLFGTSSFTENIKAMRSLGLPVIFADMMTFTYRYFFEISKDLSNMSHSMSLRGFKPMNYKELPTLASMTGTIFVRSFDQSERVFSAMTIRGYGQVMTFRNNTKIYPRDIALLLIALAFSLALIITQLYLKN